MPSANDPVAAPPWALGGGQTPDHARVWLCLDYGDDLPRVAPVLQAWYDEAIRLLSGLIQPVGAPKPKIRRSAYLKDPAGEGREVRPRAWADGLTEDYYQLTWSWYDTAPAAALAMMRLYVFRFADRRHVMLSASVDLDDRPGRLPEVLPPLLDLLGNVADVADPAYGEAVVNGESMAPDTTLDAALLRHTDVSAAQSREVLRGYEWVTLCPRELLPRLGGIGSLRASGAFSQTTELSHGGALLRATDNPADYSAERVRAVFAALSPVLPPGRPRGLPGHDLSRLVLADPADANSEPSQHIGPALPSPDDPRFAPIQQFAVEAASNGWLTELGDGEYGLSEEGQRRYDEIIEEAKRGRGPSA